VSHPYEHLCGWRGIDIAQKTVAATLPPSLSTTAPHLFGATAPRDAVLLYKAWQAVLGKYPEYPAQQIGDCVGFGHGHGNDLLQCIEIGLGQPLEYRETDSEFIYAASRQVAGIHDAQDGSYGAAAVKAMTTIGLVSRDMLGADGIYSGSRSREWGATGPPPAFRSDAAPFKLGTAALVSTWDDLVAAITNGYPVTICCDQGFELTRDAEGFCAQSGTWGHCMLIGGIRFDRPGACVLQSWGDDVPSGPTALSQPSWSFWADRTAVEAILGEGDCWALARAPSFATRVLPPAWKYDVAA